MTLSAMSPQLRPRPETGWRAARGWRRVGRLVEAFVIMLPGVLMVGFATGLISAPRDVDMSIPNPIKGVFAAMTVLSIVATLLRRRWPAACLAVTVVAGLTVEFMLFPFNPLNFYLTLTVGYFALQNERRRSLVVAGLITVLYLCSSLFTWSPERPGAAFDGAMWILAGTAIGTAMRSQRQMVRALEERAERAESAREEVILRSVAEDRVRVARELHDIIAHHVSAIGVQTGSAAQVMDTRPDLAKQLLSDARASAARVLDELQKVLGVLRQGESLVPTSVQPDRPDVDELLATSTATGMVISADGLQHLAPLAAEGFMAAYRLLQESLTNAHRHAPGSPVSIDVRRSEDGVDLEVTNAAPSHRPTAQDPHRRRFGLIGMRERIDAVGGTLEVGPTDDGGFRVWAHLPGDSFDPNSQVPQ